MGRTDLLGEAIKKILRSRTVFLKLFVTSDMTTVKQAFSQIIKEQESKLITNFGPHCGKAAETKRSCFFMSSDRN